MFTILLAILALPIPPASAARVKVVLPNQEHFCEAWLDTAKMPKAQFEKIGAFLNFESHPRDPLGFVDSTEKPGAAKSQIEKNLRYVERSIANIRQFRESRWRKLGQYYRDLARAEYERQMAAVAFMESWNPNPLKSGPDEDRLAQGASIKPEPEVTKEREEQLYREADQRILKLPLEERDVRFLTCGQRLRILADETKLEEFSAKFAQAECAGNANRNECQRRFILTSKMPKSEREGKRLYLFQWAWYNNNHCQFTGAKTEIPDLYEGPKLEELLHGVVSGEKCTEECP